MPSAEQPVSQPIIDGEQRDRDETFEVTDPNDNEVITEVVESGPELVEEAVRTSQRACSDWAAREGGERGRILDDVADIIRDNLDTLAEIDSLETGRPISHSRNWMAGERLAEYFEYYAGLADKIEGETIPVPGDRLDYTLKEPLGVTGHIIPWNGPLILGVRSMAPALAAGNAVVAKPSSQAPLSILTLGELITRSDLPDGVLNVVSGTGSTTGDALLKSEGIDSITFTGSNSVGESVMKAAAEHMIPAKMELGGKSPNIVFPDADLQQAAEDSVKAFYNAGQVCFAGTRVFVHEDIYDEFTEKLVAETERLEVGDSRTDPDVGPLISKRARDDVARYVDEAVEDGAQVLTGGEIPRDQGNFYAPTLLDNVQDDDPISCDELFGPVLTVYEFGSEEEVVGRANDTKYGLYSILWTQDVDRAHAIAEQIEAGTVAVNEYPAIFNEAPYGGYKMSGIGRVNGQQAIENYVETKNVVVSWSE